MALFTVLGSLATSCQKENFDEMQISTEQQNALYVVQYTVDGVTYTQTLYSDEEYDALLQQMLLWAREGKRVRFHDVNCYNGTSSTKGTLHYYTDNEADAKAWCAARAEEGYEVTCEWDARLGKYHCIANN